MESREMPAVTNLLLLREILQGFEYHQVGPDGNPTTTQITLALAIHELSTGLQDEAVRAGIQTIVGKYVAHQAGRLGPAT